MGNNVNWSEIINFINPVPSKMEGFTKQPKFNFNNNRVPRVDIPFYLNAAEKLGLKIQAVPDKPLTEENKETTWTLKSIGRELTNEEVLALNEEVTQAIVAEIEKK